MFINEKPKETREKAKEQDRKNTFFYKKMICISTQFFDTLFDWQSNQQSITLHICY